MDHLTTENKTTKSNNLGQDQVNFEGSGGACETMRRNPDPRQLTREIKIYTLQANPWMQLRSEWEKQPYPW